MHDIVLKKRRRWIASGVGGAADGNVAIAPQITEVSQKLARDADLLVGMAKLPKLARATNS